MKPQVWHVFCYTLPTRHLFFILFFPGGFFSVVCIFWDVCLGLMTFQKTKTYFVNSSARVHRTRVSVFGLSEVRREHLDFCAVKVKNEGVCCLVCTWFQYMIIF